MVMGVFFGAGLSLSPFIKPQYFLAGRGRFNGSGIWVGVGVGERPQEGGEG